MKAYKETHYWKCEECGIFSREISLHSAHIELEKHEKAVHKKKQIGSFGTKITENKSV